MGGGGSASPGGGFAGIPSKGTGTPNQLRKYREQSHRDGRESLERSRQSLKRRLDEHTEKLKEIMREGGFISSVIREIVNFLNEIDAIEQVLRGGNR